MLSLISLSLPHRFCAFQCPQLPGSLCQVCLVCRTWPLPTHCCLLKVSARCHWPSWSLEPGLPVQDGWARLAVHGLIPGLVGSYGRKGHTLSVVSEGHRGTGIPHITQNFIFLALRNFMCTLLFHNYSLNFESSHETL